MSKARSKSPATAILYTRVSTGRQAAEGMSLEAQGRTLADAATAAGYTCLAISDEGKSGKAVSTRPGLQEALTLLNTGQAAALYVARLDRLARSVTDLLAVVDQAHRNKWRLVLLDVGVDTASDSGRLILSMLGSVAEYERRLIAARQRDVHAERRSRGEVWGVTKGNRPETPAAVRRRVATLRADGLTLRAIADTLNADGIATVRGGSKWYASTVRHLLTSPSMRAAA
jgi:DNA invertase Pin-like site-specific DNA recombinase